MKIVAAITLVTCLGAYAWAATASYHDARMQAIYCRHMTQIFKQTAGAYGWPPEVCK